MHTVDRLCIVRSLPLGPDGGAAFWDMIFRGAADWGLLRPWAIHQGWHFASMAGWHGWLAIHQGWLASTIHQGWHPPSIRTGSLLCTWLCTHKTNSQKAGVCFESLG